MAEFLKDYGPAIGPTLAFVLGMLALYGKYRFDQISARWTVARRIDNLSSLVAKVGPPPEYFPQSADDGLIHADEARNVTNLARFYAHLLALKPVVEAVGKSVADSGNENQVIRFHSAKWWFDILMTTVEKWRSTENFRLSPTDYANLLSEWKLFVETLSGKADMNYIQTRRAGRET